MSNLERLEIIRLIDSFKVGVIQRATILYRANFQDNPVNFVKQECLSLIKSGDG